MEAPLRRKAYDRLLEWKNESQGSTAILVNGARRVGKSFLVRRFAEEQYRSSIVIDFAKTSEYVMEAFDSYNGNLDDFFESLMVAAGTRLFERESVIVFDEVQLYPRARQMIKYLVDDGRYDYIETGSLISIKSNVQDIVVPSEEDDLQMFPLDFEEFLWAMGDEVSMDLMRRCFEELRPLGNGPHKAIMSQFRKYMLVGGMPQAVVEYVDTRSFERTEAVKKRILSVYRKDISKYAGGYRQRVNSIFDSIPSQLSKGEKKFVLASLGKNARSRQYDDAFMWLADGMIVNPCVNATDPTVGLMMRADFTSQKLYMGDTGLLVTESLADVDSTNEAIYKSLLLGKIGINEGMFAENVVAQCLRASGKELFFYSRYPKARGAGDGSAEDVDPEESWDSPVEIDFLVRRGGRICPVEVKSSDKIRHGSLDKFIDKFSGRIGQPYVLCTKDVRVKDGIVYLPLYMACLLRGGRSRYSEREGFKGMIQLDVLCIGWLERAEDGAVTEAHSTSTLIRAEGRNIVVDTSTPYMWPAVKTSFRQIGIFPEDVDTVVLTHAHEDHIGNLRRYRKAKVLIHSGSDVEIPGAEVVDCDELVLCPGVRMVHTPGHCPEESSVFVEADRHYVCAGDAVPLADNMKEGKPPAIATDRDLAVESMEAIRRFADVVVPGHGAPFML